MVPFLAIMAILNMRLRLCSAAAAVAAACSCVAVLRSTWPAACEYGTARAACSLSAAAHAQACYIQRMGYVAYVATYPAKHQVQSRI